MKDLVLRPLKLAPKVDDYAMLSTKAQVTLKALEKKYSRLLHQLQYQERNVQTPFHDPSKYYASIYENTFRCGRQNVPPNSQNRYLNSEEETKRNFSILSNDLRTFQSSKRSMKNEMIPVTSQRLTKTSNVIYDADYWGNMHVTNTVAELQPLDEEIAKDILSLTQMTSAPVSPSMDFDADTDFSDLQHLDKQHFLVKSHGANSVTTLCEPAQYVPFSPLTKVTQDSGNMCTSKLHSTGYWFQSSQSNKCDNISVSLKDDIRPTAQSPILLRSCQNRESPGAIVNNSVPEKSTPVENNSEPLIRNLMGQKMYSIESPTNSIWMSADYREFSMQGAAHIDEENIEEATGEYMDKTSETVEDMESVDFDLSYFCKKQDEISDIPVCKSHANDKGNIDVENPFTISQKSEKGSCKVAIASDLFEHADKKPVTKTKHPDSKCKHEGHSRLIPGSLGHCKMKTTKSTDKSSMLEGQSSGLIVSNSNPGKKTSEEPSSEPQIRDPMVQKMYGVESPTGSVWMSADYRELPIESEANVDEENIGEATKKRLGQTLETADVTESVDFDLCFFSKKEDEISDIAMCESNASDTGAIDVENPFAISQNSGEGINHKVAVASDLFECAGVEAMTKTKYPESKCKHEGQSRLILGSLGHSKMKPTKSMDNSSMLEGQSSGLIVSKANSGKRTSKEYNSEPVIRDPMGQQKYSIESPTNSIWVSADCRELTMQSAAHIDEENIEEVTEKLSAQASETVAVTESVDFDLCFFSTNEDEISDIATCESHANDEGALDVENPLAVSLKPREDRSHKVGNVSDHFDHTDEEPMTKTKHPESKSKHKDQSRLIIGSLSHSKMKPTKSTDKFSMLGRQSSGHIVRNSNPGKSSSEGNSSEPLNSASISQQIYNIESPTNTERRVNNGCIQSKKRLQVDDFRRPGVKKIKSTFKPPSQILSNKETNDNTQETNRGENMSTADEKIIIVKSTSQNKLQEFLRQIESSSILTLSLLYNDGQALTNTFYSIQEKKKMSQQGKNLSLSCFLVQIECLHSQIICLPIEPEYMTMIRNTILSVLSKKTVLKIIPHCKDFLIAVHKLLHVKNDHEILCENVEDPVLAAWLLNPESPPDSFSQLCLTVKFPFSEREEEWQACLGKVPQLMEKAKTNLKSEKLWTLFCKMEMKLVPLLACMETRCIKVDTKTLLRFSDILKCKLTKLEEQIYKEAGHKFSLNSHPQLRQVLYEELQLDKKLPPTTKIGKTTASHLMSTSESSLNLMVHVHPLPSLILEYRQLQKLKSTYVDGMMSCVSEGTLMTHWDQTAAVTGRLTSCQPNIQAVPKTVITIMDYTTNYNIGSDSPSSADIYAREPFISQPGFIFLAADFQQIELRILSHLAEDQDLLSLFWKPQAEDIFVSLSSQWHNKPQHAVTMSEREKTKKVVYSVMYGIGKDKLADYLNVTPDIAKDIIKSFLRRFPGIDQFTKKCWSYAEEYGYTETICGRRRYFPRIRHSTPNLRAQAQRQAVNFCVQGSAADICKLAMLAVEQRLREQECLACRLLIQIHDELVWEVPESQFTEATEIIRQVMENTAVLCKDFTTLQVPLPVTLSSGKSWAHLTPLSSLSTGSGNV